MRLCNTLASLLLAAAPLASAVFRDEVGDIDFHHSLIGVPQPDRTFFHKPRRDEKASLLYSLSDVGIIGAVNPGTGAVVWRQPLERVNATLGNHTGFLRAGDGENWLAAARGSSVHVWNAVTGRNVWWDDFEGRVKDLEILEVTTGREKDLLALFEETDAAVARKLSGATGRVIWEHREAGRDVPLQVSTDGSSVFLVNLQGSPLAYSIKIVVLDSLTGRRLRELVLGAKSDIESLNDVMFVGANSAAPILAWTDTALTTLKMNILGTPTLQEFRLAADTVGVEIHAPQHAQSDPHFLLHTRTRTGSRAKVFHIDLKSAKILSAYELPHISGENTFSLSSSSTGSDVFVTRVTETEVLLTSSASHGVLGRWPFEPGLALEPVRCASEVLKKADGSFAVRSAVVTRSDDWALVRAGHVDWTRPEGLTGAVAAAWAEIPENEALARILEEEAHTNPLSAFVHRVRRHLDDAQHLPDYLANLPKRILSSILGTELGAKTDGLSRDMFGFSKLAILATGRGRLYGLDFGNSGRIVWSIRAFEQPEGRYWDVKGMFVDDSKGTVTIQGSLGESITVKVDSGDIVEVTPPGSSDVQATAVVNSEAGVWMIPIRVDGTARSVPASRIPKEETIVVRGVAGELRGLTFSKEDERLVRETVTWTFVPPAGQNIVTIATRPTHDPVASIGRVLGDRRVLYKYLNPNTFLVAAIDSKPTLTTYLIDGVSGQVLASATHAGVDPTRPISCALADNWFVCSFFGQYRLSDGTGRSLRGYQMVVSDLFESAEPNDRGPLKDAHNASSLDPYENPSTGPSLPAVISQAFVISMPVTNLAVTQTRQGITVRNVLAYLPELGAIATLPRQILDPRRPVGRDPTAQELEVEGLPRYMPVIEVDARSLVTHECEVLGVKQIVASPTGVESTSLVLAFGVDVFGTRVAPSMSFDILGKGFNKVSMVLTVVALLIGVVGLKPLVSLRAVLVEEGLSGVGIDPC